MDTATTTSLNSFIAHPASLFIGQPQELLEQVIILLQRHLCTQHGCSVCIICRKIQEQQHESITWLNPEKQYALDDLKIISSTLSFSLDPGHHFFFVLAKADTLTPACANALLKSLEEPPAGYHFILLAQRQEAILPTIQSRCLIQIIGQQTATAALASLMPYFTTTAFQDPLAFTKELEAANPTEWQSLELLDALLIHWSTTYKKSVVAQEKQKAQQAYTMIMHLKKALSQPPMPGSSKLFWKNLFLQIKEL